MGTEVTLFDNAGLPAYLADINAETNIEVRERIPQLSFRGGHWRIVMGGTEEIINRPGTDEPAQQVAGVFLDYNKKRSRAYFEGAYEEGSSKPPTCWSHDGVKPHITVREKQSVYCADCPQAAKGSKITESGKEVTACSQFKRIAFVPIQNTKHPILLLKIPQTSMWDKDAEEWAAKGWFAFDQYVETLFRNGVQHTGAVVTKIRFDPRTSYPKLLFGPLGWVPKELADDIRMQLAKKDEINIVLNVDPSGVEPGETPAPEAPAAPPAAAKGKAAPPPPEPAPEPSEDDEAAAIMAAATGRPAPPAAAAPIAAKTTQRRGRPPAAPTAAINPPIEQTKVVPPGNSESRGIKDLLSSWSDET